MVRGIVIGGLVGGALLVTGCATKKFVQEEVAKSQTKVVGDAGRVDRRLEDEKGTDRWAPEGARRLNRRVAIRVSAPAE